MIPGAGCAPHRAAVVFLGELRQLGFEVAHEVQAPVAVDVLALVVAFPQAFLAAGAAGNHGKPGRKGRAASAG